MYNFDKTIHWPGKYIRKVNLHMSYLTVINPILTVKISKFMLNVKIPQNYTALNLYFLRVTFSNITPGTEKTRVIFIYFLIFFLFRSAKYNKVEWNKSVKKYVLLEWHPSKICTHFIYSFILGDKQHGGFTAKYMI